VIREDFLRYFVCLIKFKLHISRFILLSFSFLLVLGLFVGPLGVQAGFFSSLLGNEVSASTDVKNQIEFEKNSQNMPLLQANVSSALIVQNKKNKENSNELEENINVKIVSENALLPVLGPLGATGGGDIEEFSFQEISVYVVRKGDSISEIAEMFDVSVNTILWANDMKKNDKLSIGDTLVILPISGIEHTIGKGETLSGIAKLYKADISDIARFNGLTEEAKISIGDKIIVPGGEIYNETSSSPRPIVNSKNTNSSIANTTGYFVNPVPGYSRRSQGLHGPGNRGVDLAAPTGTPIYASASGTVLLARVGWNGAYGNMVVITHSNGTKTLYAHMSKIATSTGKSVYKGEIIGYVGSTGRSTGPHLHFEVFNAKNPGGTTPMSFASR
jgi:LysM repeat protein